MGFGDWLSSSYNTALDAAKRAADTMMSSASKAADAVARGAALARDTTMAAAQATADAAVTGARAVSDTAMAAAQATADAAVAGARAVSDTSVAVANATADAAVVGAKVVEDVSAFIGHAAANVADFSARALTEAVGAALPASPPYQVYQQARALFSETKTSRDTAVASCPNSWEEKKKRMEDRQRLIDAASSPAHANDPAMKAAAKRLQRNTEAVELARLSADTYDQYDPKNPKDTPPLGWKKISDAELEERGISPDLLRESRAVVYQSEPDWPGGQKTVVGFRGTADFEDAIVDHDQALRLTTRQYEASARLGTEVRDTLGPDTLVTGHSLGGGKAQAAGAMGQLGGMMFNSAGLHPNSVNDIMPSANQFQQYRTFGDPLTGSQNSAIAQSLAAAGAGVAMPVGLGMTLGNAAAQALGLEVPPSSIAAADKALMALPRGLTNLLLDGNILPPAIGPIREIPALSPDGQPYAMFNVGKQHSILSVVNGIEKQKTEDVSTLQAGTQ